jgi:hypothetical protein
MGSPAFAPETSVLNRISGLLDEINAEKTASVKRADDGTVLGHSGQGSKDPGGYQGPSSHLSAKVDSNTQATPLGERFKENAADMKDKHAVGNVDSTSEGGGGSQDSKQIQSGTVQSSTGEQPSVEDHFKGTKDDKRQGNRGGTSSPVNAEDTGEKYGSMPLEQLTKLAYTRMDECLADMANGVTLSKTASPSQPAAQVQTPAIQQTQKTATDNSQAALAAQAGYELASAVAQAPDVEMEKSAAVQQLLENFIKTALEDADLVGQYLHRFAAERRAELSKRADDGAGAPPMPPGMGGDPMGGGGAPPGMGGDPMGGGAPPGGAGAPPGMGGDPMGGGAPPGAGGPGGGGGQEDAINELAMALMELGIQPEQLIQAMQSAGGGGGPPGGDAGAGGPPGGGEKAGAARLTVEERQQLIKIAHAVKDHQKSGRLRIKEANGQARADREEIKAYIREVCR